MTRFLSYPILVAFGFALILATASSVFAVWSDPTDVPPNANTAAPLNTGATTQTKTGGLWAASMGTDNGYCIGVDCVTDWTDISGAWTINGANIHYSGGNVSIGTTDTTTLLTVDGDVTATGYFHASDERLKNTIKTSAGLDIIKQLRGTTFTWKDNGTPAAGVIAQEVESVLPKAVRTSADGYKSVEYDQLLAPIIESLKELAAENERLKERVHELELRASAVPAAL
jgi:hypothetical protein